MNLNTSNILVTGGAGFIGSNFIYYLLKKSNFQGTIINYDKLTYASNLSNLCNIIYKKYIFKYGDICDYHILYNIFKKYNINLVIHFAAETHVDNSISSPAQFIHSNINGTFNLLEVCRKVWENRKDVRFHHISTDEVYGSLGLKGFFYEDTPYNPRSPYSASKAASDHLVRSYFHTYNLPITISNCSNNYGPYQHKEKLIPKTILNAINDEPIPVYGEGKNIRDWLYVEDHCDAIWTILQKGTIGETYNIGGECEKQNIEIVKSICKNLNNILPAQNYNNLITFVTDRKGHDWRYAVNCDKIKALGWKQKYSFEERLKYTIDWYVGNLTSF